MKIQMAPGSVSDEVSTLFFDYKPPPRWKHADGEDRRRAAAIPYGHSELRSSRRVEFCTEEAYGADEEFHDALVKMRCPSCRRMCAPLLSTRTRLLENGWRWVGLEYREPYSQWLCVCPGCRTDYILTTHTPQ